MVRPVSRRGGKLTRRGGAVSGEFGGAGFVDLEVGMSAPAAISNCPQIANLCSGRNPTTIRVVIWPPD